MSAEEYDYRSPCCGEFNSVDFYYTDDATGEEHYQCSSCGAEIVCLGESIVRIERF